MSDRPPREPSGEPASTDFEVILLELRELVESARTMPMSASALVNREEMLGILQEGLDAIPDELRHAKFLLKDRDAVLAQARREADDILTQARVQAERMVERAEITREARRTAERVVEDAESESRRMRHEAEDYVDRRLGEFEVVLERVLASVRKGREQLQVVVEPLGFPEEEAEAEQAFFDQDET